MTWHAQSHLDESYLGLAEAAMPIMSLAPTTHIQHLSNFIYVPQPRVAYL